MSLWYSYLCQFQADHMHISEMLFLDFFIANLKALLGRLGKAFPTCPNFPSVCNSISPLKKRAQYDVYVFYTLPGIGCGKLDSK